MLILLVNLAKTFYDNFMTLNMEVIIRNISIKKNHFDTVDASDI